MMKRLLTIIFALASMWAQAQEEMDADRPDQSENAHVLEAGEFQVETGLLVDNYEEGESSIIESALLRYGVTKGLEARLNF